jgi:hypothetical protein
MISGRSYARVWSASPSRISTRSDKPAVAEFSRLRDLRWLELGAGEAAASVVVKCGGQMERGNSEGSPEFHNGTRSRGTASIYSMEPFRGKPRGESPSCWNRTLDSRRGWPSSGHGPHLKSPLFAAGARRRWHPHRQRDPLKSVERGGLRRVVIFVRNYDGARKLLFQDTSPVLRRSLQQGGPKSPGGKP